MNQDPPGEHMEYKKSDFDEWDVAQSQAADDQRLGAYVSFGSSEVDGARLAIAGFPVDDGVRINGGRVGAAHAPDEIRSVLYAMTPDSRSAEAHLAVLGKTLDVGNLKAGRSLAEKQEALGRFVADCLAVGVVPVILGGGHETAFGHFLGYAEAESPVNIVNVDAHADVRPLVGELGHSGSSFRQAMDHPGGWCRSYSVAGLQPGRNAASHIRYLVDRKAQAYWVGETTDEVLHRMLIPADGSGAVMVTFDMDAVDQSYAPGVSAPAVGGLEQRMAIQFALLAGSSPAVTSLDLAEVNPLVDEGGRTVRLAAQFIWSFLLGFTQRA